MSARRRKISAETRRLVRKIGIRLTVVISKARVRRSGDWIKQTVLSSLEDSVVVVSELDARSEDVRVLLRRQCWSVSTE